jgi:hypothetical protein
MILLFKDIFTEKIGEKDWRFCLKTVQNDAKIGS